MARDFDEAAYEEDVVLLTYLQDVLLKINDLKKQVEDIFILAGAESYKATGLVRDFMKANNKDNPVYKNMLNDLDAYFKKTKTKTEESSEEEGKKKGGE